MVPKSFITADSSRTDRSAKLSERCPSDAADDSLRSSAGRHSNLLRHENLGGWSLAPKQQNSFHWHFDQGWISPPGWSPTYGELILAAVADGLCNEGVGALVERDARMTCDLYESQVPKFATHSAEVCDEFDVGFGFPSLCQ